MVGLIGVFAENIVIVRTCLKCMFNRISYGTFCQRFMTVLERAVIFLKLICTPWCSAIVSHTGAAGR